jgi:hypothetical protein
MKGDEFASTSGSTTCWSSAVCLPAVYALIGQTRYCREIPRVQACPVWKFHALHCKNRHAFPAKRKDCLWPVFGQ